MRGQPPAQRGLRPGGRAEVRRDLTEGNEGNKGQLQEFTAFLGSLRYLLFAFSDGASKEATGFGS